MPTLRIVCSVVVLALSIACVPTAQAQDVEPSFEDVEAPEGPLGADRRAEVATVIDQLADHPTAPGAEAARAAFFRWLTTSPDVSVTVCPGVAGPLLSEDSDPLQSTLLTQYLLSMAAHRLRADGAASPIDTHLAGVRGVVRAYRALHADGNTHPAGDLFLRKADAGTLRAYVRDGVETCDG